MARHETFTCDRCGATYEGFAGNVARNGQKWITVGRTEQRVFIRAFRFVKDRHDHEPDLCGACEDSLAAWFWPAPDKGDTDAASAAGLREERDRWKAEHDRLMAIRNEFGEPAILRAERDEARESAAQLAEALRGAEAAFDRLLRLQSSYDRDRGKTTHLIGNLQAREMLAGAANRARGSLAVFDAKADPSAPTTEGTDE